MRSLEKKLTKRKALGHLRTLKPQQQLIDFASNDYLGLARSTELKRAVLKEEQSGLNTLGSTGSRLLTGNSTYAEALEKQIALFHGFESALLFNCGYMANVGLISSIADDHDIILYDTHIHASTHDGMTLSGANCFPFRHNDLNHLEFRLKRHEGAFVCIESLYSMDGTFAPLKDVLSLCQKYSAHLIVDEAHGVGVFGPDGKGLLAQEKIEPEQIFAQITTFGKALGCSGAAVLGGSLLKEGLINFARPFIYSTAPPLHALFAIKGAYDLLPSLERQRRQLRVLIHQFSETSLSPVQPTLIKGNAQVQKASLDLAQNGFDVRPIMSPTVQKGSECLRVCIHAFNTEQEIAELKKALQLYG